MRLLERSALVLTVIALLGASGCAKKIGATYDPFVIFPATAQWTWNEEMNKIPNDPSMEALNIRSIVREAITEGLAKRGYTLAPAGGKAEFRVHYQVGIGQKIEQDSVKSYASLSLTLVDTKTDRSAWVGFIKTGADIATPEAQRRKRLREQMNKMLKNFPPNQPK
jgi:hypothetical protein